MKEICGNPNPKLATVTLKFYLTLANNVNHKGYEFVTGNIVLMSLRHTIRISTEKIITPLINPDMSNTVDKL